MDVFKGTIARLHSIPRYDHALVMPGCGLRASPARDVGGAAIGSTDSYYLATRGCPDACVNERSLGSLGASSRGVARPMPWGVPDSTCP